MRVKTQSVSKLHARTQKTLVKETVLKGFQKVINILTLLAQGHVTHTGWGSQEGGRIFAKQRRENKEQKVFSKQQRRGPKIMSCLLPRRVRKQRGRYEHKNKEKAWEELKGKKKNKKGA